MMQYRRRHMRRLYFDWKARALACKIADGWTCQQCGVKQFTVRHSSTTGNPYVVYLHAAHVHVDDPLRNDRELLTLCLTCHARYDARCKRVRIERLKHRRLLAPWHAWTTARTIACLLTLLPAGETHE